MLNDLWRRHYRDPANNPMPRIPRPPKIRNFRAIPVHNFHTKNIRIDLHLFYQIACKLGALKLAKGKRTKLIDISKDVYDANDANLRFYWDRVFDMDKIDRVGKQKTFDFAIVTDGVAVSLCFVKPEREPISYSDDEIRQMYENMQFTFVLGMDPGVRTWNATVRKHIQSGVEVCIQYNYNTFNS